MVTAPHLEACTVHTGGGCSCGMELPKKRGRPGPKKRHIESVKFEDLPADVLNAAARYDPKGPW